MSCVLRPLCFCLPYGRLNNSRCPYEETDPVPTSVLDKKSAYDFMRMRRSIRNFKDELVSEEKITELLDIARYAPSAANSQGLYYIVVSDRELIRLPTAWLIGCRKKSTEKLPSAGTI